MCNYNLQFNKNTFEFKNDVHLLPIPIEINYSDYFYKRKAEKQIRIGWISRLERDKNRILTLLIDDLVNSNIENLELAVIGNGDDEKFIKDYVRKSRLKNVRFVGKIETENMTDFLITNIDLGFSMGTSALEFALRKIPSVLVPATTEFRYFSKQVKKYEWIQNIGGFDVCTYKMNSRCYKEFSSIINDYIEKKELLQKEAYFYVFENHNINTVGSDLIKLLNKCTLNLLDLKEIGIDNHSLFEKIKFLLKKAYKNILVN
jgi:hypothetical protein